MSTKDDLDDDFEDFDSEADFSGDDEAVKASEEDEDDDFEDDEDEDLEASEPEADEPDEDELSKYSKSVQKRISEEVRKRHDLKRERDEIVTVARRLAEENAAFKKQLTEAQKATLSTTKDAAEAEIKQIKAKLKEAVAEGDGELAAELTDQLTEAKLRAVAAASVHQRIEEMPEDEPEEVQPKTPARPQLNEVQEKWWNRNKSWFQKDEEMTSLAMAVNKRLIRQGVDPEAPEFYQAIDKEMRKRFPDRFEKKKPPKGQGVTFERTGPAAGAKTKVRLTPNQIRIAKKFGLTLEQYAKELRSMDRD